MKKNMNVTESEIMELAQDYSRSFLCKNEEPSIVLMNRMKLLAKAKLEGWGAKIILPSGNPIAFSAIRAFVIKCARETSDGLGPLDHMDSEIELFLNKHCHSVNDRILLDDLCYDVNTLDC